MATEYYDKNGNRISAAFAQNIQKNGGTVTVKESGGSVNTGVPANAQTQVKSAIVDNSAPSGTSMAPGSAYGAWNTPQGQIERLTVANSISPATYHRKQLRAADPTYNDFYQSYDGFNIYDRSGNVLATDADQAAQHAILKGETYNTYGMSPDYLAWLESQGYTDNYNPTTDVYGANYSGTFGSGYANVGYPENFDYSKQGMVRNADGTWTSTTNLGSFGGAYSTSGGSGGYGGGYEDMMAASDAQYAAAMNSYNLAEDQINAGYDNLAKQAYTQMRMTEKNLPYATSSYSSGTADSLALQNQLAYQNYSNANEAARMNALAELEAQRQQAQADYEMQQAQMQYNYDMAMMEYEQELALAEMEAQAKAAEKSSKAKTAGTTAGTSGYDWSDVDAVQLVQGSIMTEEEFRRRRAANNYYGTNAYLPYETYEDYVAQALKDRKNSGGLTTSEYNRLRSIYGV